jgi:hypothetical protein
LEDGVKASELMAILAKLGDEIPSDTRKSGRRETVEESLQTVDMVLDSIPGAREFLEAHAEQIFLAGIGGKFRFEDREL